MEKKEDIGRQRVSSSVCALTWSPRGNAVAMINTGGYATVWKDPVPPHMVGPTDGAENTAGGGGAEGRGGRGGIG